MSEPVFPTRTPYPSCSIRYHDDHLCNRASQYYCPECQEYRCGRHVYYLETEAGEPYHCHHCTNVVDSIPGIEV
jgi:hypothetical protein